MTATELVDDWLLRALIQWNAEDAARICQSRPRKTWAAMKASK